MLRLQIIGNIGRDAELRTLDSGSTAISFNVAVTEKYKDRAGQMVENTTWVNCTKWVQAGGSTKIADYLKKGTRVLVEGKPSARAYAANSGEAKAQLELRVELIELLGGSPQGSTQPARTAGPAQTTPSPAVDDEVTDDLPF